MTQKEFLLIQTLISEDEKNLETFDYENHELSSWHKSPQINLRKKKNIHSPNIPILPKITQRQNEREATNKIQAELNKNSASLIEENFTKKHPYVKVESTSDFKGNPAELKSLESLLVKLREIPTRVISKKINVPYLKPYKKYQQSYAKYMGQMTGCPKSIFGIGFESLKNNKIKTEDSSNLSMLSPSEKVIQESNSKIDSVFQNKNFDSSYILNKEKRIKSISLGVDQRRSVVYGYFNRNTTPKKLLFNNAV